VREFSDRSVRDVESLEGLAGIPVISTIPSIVTAEDLAARRQRRWVATATTLGCVVGAITAFHFLIMDLDVFYAKLERVVLRKIP